DFQPPLQQIELRALARPIRSFHHDQCARIRAAGNRLAWLRKCGFRRLGPRRLLYSVLCFGHLVREKLVCRDSNPSLLLWHYNTRSHFRQISTDCFITCDDALIVVIPERGASFVLRTGLRSEGSHLILVSLSI